MVNKFNADKRKKNKVQIWIVKWFEYIWWGPFKYDHMFTQSNEHLVAWFEPGYNDYVTLLINFETNTLYGSAILGGKKRHFQKAKIEQISTPNQLWDRN